MAKMFYSAEETAAKLNVAVDKLKELVDQNKLREFRDGNRVMFKVDQVDRIAGGSANAGSGGPIDLAAGAGSGSSVGGSGDTKTMMAHSSGSGVIGLSGSVAGQSGVSMSASSKSGSVAGAGGSATAPAQGMKVFDTHEIKPADANAQTQISQSLDEAISPSGMDSVGSGSGLLDLTRESDNTSLGAELLEEIYPGDSSAGSKTGIGSSSGVFDQTVTAGPEASLAAGETNMAAASVPVTATYAAVYEAPDPAAGFFGGAALAAVLVMGLTLVAVMMAMEGFTPRWMHTLGANAVLFIALLVVLSALLAFVGYFVGKASAR